MFFCESNSRFNLRRTDCGDSGDDFTELKLVENGGLSSSVKSNHEDSHLLLSPEAVEQF